MLWESAITLAKQNIFSILRFPFWLVKGKAYLKHEIARRVTLDVSTLPYNDEFVTFLREQRRAGRKLVLITGCANVFAQQIADHLGIFTDVIASTTNTNMTGKQKVKALQEKYGKRGFEYAGNEKADLAVWANSCGAIVVNAPERLVLKVKRVTPLNRSFHARRRRLAVLVRVMLPKH
jgi:phosphoserine phosphatase